MVAGFAQCKNKAVNRGGAGVPQAPKVSQAFEQNEVAFSTREGEK
jgi:hypothetical protein